jgi:hypothetical protein
MTTDNFGFYLQNRLIQSSQTGGQQYTDTSPFGIPYLVQCSAWQLLRTLDDEMYQGTLIGGGGSVQLTSLY